MIQSTQGQLHLFEQGVVGRVLGQQLSHGLQPPGFQQRCLDPVTAGQLAKQGAGGASNRRLAQACDGDKGPAGDSVQGGKVGNQQMGISNVIGKAGVQGLRCTIEDPCYNVTLG